eukprot:767083-Hanusia_phi.AAC.6
MALGLKEPDVKKKSMSALSSSHLSLCRSDPHLLASSPRLPWSRRPHVLVAPYRKSAMQMRLAMKSSLIPPHTAHVGPGPGSVRLRD